MAAMAKRAAIQKFALICAAVVLVAVMIFTIAVKVASSRQHTVKDGYMVVTDIPGVTFEVEKTLSDYATALDEVSKDSTLENIVTYSYKDGDSFYMLFNLYNFIVVAKKGTTFNFDERDISSALNASNLNGIWFTEHGKDPVLESSNGVYTINVQAEVVITNASYNDFAGTLTTLVKNGEEWSLFAGYTEKGQEEYQEAMDYIATTFAFEGE